MRLTFIDFRLNRVMHLVRTNSADYERSARQGNSYGQIALGRCLIEGIGVRADPVKAAALVRH
jgi:hypothetical protein